MTRVLVIDDSDVVRDALSSHLCASQDIEVVGTAVDAFIAQDKVARLQPDVAVLDLEMPGTDGLVLLTKIMTHHPVPVVVVSSLGPEGARAAICALHLGAVDIVNRPGPGVSAAETIEELANKVHAAAAAHAGHGREHISTPVAALHGLGHDHVILAVGASTGGAEAILHVLSHLPAGGPATLLVHDLPPDPTAAFAERLDQSSPMEVREAREGDPVVAGCVLVAPGDHHMTLRPHGAHFAVGVKGGPKVFHHRPSIDVLFHSVAQHAGSNALGILLSGAGGDGAQGLLAMKQAGAHTLAQDEDSSVAFDLPAEAGRMGAVTQFVPLGRMSHHALQVLAQRTVGALRRSG